MYKHDERTEIHINLYGARISIATNTYMYIMIMKPVELDKNAGLEK